MAVLAVMLMVLLIVLSSGASENDLPDWQEPRLIKNILSKTEDSAFYPIGEMNSHLLFFAQHQGVNRNRQELWRTDGTPDGTIMLEERQMDTVSADYFILGDKLLFLALHPDYGRELWISDGAPGDAQVMGNAFPDAFDGNVASHTVSGDYLYFTAYDDVNQTELWRTDGTLAGTIRLTGPDLGLDVGLPGSLIDVNGTLFFLGYTDGNKALLLKSDGTPVTTTIVKEADGSAFGGPSFAVDGLLYFVGREIWRSDGTEQGTYVIHTFSDYYGVPEWGSVAAATRVYFVVQDSNYNYELWQSRGTAATTTLIAAVNGFYGHMTTAGDRLFFSLTDQDHGTELWTSDGTPAGTKMVKDIMPGQESSGPENLVVVGDRVYFNADDPTQVETLWRSDGTAVGTVKVPLPGASADYDLAKPLAPYKDELFFRGADVTHGREPWMTTGRGASAVFLTDINQTDELSSHPGYFLYTNNLLFFWTTQGLWRSDGTASGTSTVVNNIYLHREVRQDGETFATVGDWLYFAIDDRPNNDVELWRTDGTVAGTTLVMNAVAPMFREDPIYSMADVNGMLYFARYGNSRGRKELWRSDGTPGGTFHVATPYPPDPNNVQSSLIDEITGVGNTVYFVATNGVNGVELWRSNGTTAGTAMVKDIKPGNTGSEPSNLTAVGGHVFFFADDGIHGRELWRSDGTTNGTIMVKDILPGPTSSLPAELTQFGGAAYFAAHDGIHGRELWRSDGTANGTVLVKDILPGGSSNPRQLTTSDAGLFFFAGDDTSLNPYKSDGTVAGTTRMAIVSYNDFELPEKLTAVNEWVFFVKGDRLFQAGGPTIGTVAQDEAYPDFQAHQFTNLTAGRDRLFFATTHLMYGNEPFVKNLVLAENNPNILYVTEGGITTHFRLSLKAKPQSSLTVNFASADIDLEISPSSHTFTPQNWNTPATIGVRTTNSRSSGVREATITQTFESADDDINGTVLELAVRVGWRLGYMPITMR
jgi:ELWxxDGT repeat protein